MRLQVLSDIHVEFYPSKIAAMNMLKTLPAKDVDGVIIAGDFGVSTCKWYRECLEFICQLWKEVIFVPGNHDWWSDDPAEPGASYLMTASKYRNFRCLLNSSIILKGKIEIFGSTLWFHDEVEDEVETDGMWWIDYAYVLGGFDWIKKQNEIAEDKIAKFLDKRDPQNGAPIIITHHLPLPESIDSRYAGYDTNKYFMYDMSEYIQRYLPAYWIHGHTHTSCNYELYETRILCNPMGYPSKGYLENSSFDPNLIIEI